MIKNLLIILTCVLITLNLQAQNLHVAKIGDDLISDKEFKLRFETMPHITDDNFNLDSVKIKILSTIIAEKLWAKYAIEVGIDTTSYFKSLFTPIERLFVRDALYKKVVVPKTELSEDDIKFVTQFGNSKAITDFYAFDDSISADKAYNGLVNSFAIPKNIKVYADTAKEVTIGFMEDEDLEKQILTAKSMTIFHPFKTPAGWFVLQKRYNARIAETTDNQNISTLKQKMIERRAKQFGSNYLKNLLGDIKLSINEIPFSTLSDVFFEHYKLKISVDSTLKAKSLLFDDNDFGIIKNKMSNLGNSVLIYANNFKYTTNAFLTFLMYEDFKLKNPTKEGIKKKLVDYIKFFTEQEFITEEGIKQNLLNSPAVQEDLKVWKENLLAQLIENNYVDTIKINENDIRNEYNKRYSEKEVLEEIKVQEILVDNLEKVEKILNDIDKGVDFGYLAEKNTLRSSFKQKQGVLGYITNKMFGEIGRIAESLNINEIFGPIKSTEGYSIIKILDKKKNETKASFESVKDIIKEGLFSQKSYKLLNNKTIELAKKYGAEINYSNLTNIKVTNINMFTHRFMGFGGKIAASPFTNSLYDWYEIYKKSKNESL